MSRIKAIFRQPHLLVFFFVFMAVALVFYSGLRASASKKKDNAQVKSLAPYLTVVDVQVHENHVLLSLRNDYDKTITAFSVSSSGVITRNEMLDSEHVIAPGSITKGEYELPSPSRPDKGLTILAAVFEDGTSDGGHIFIQQILDARAGKQSQLARILSILEETAITSKNIDSKEKWQTVRLRIAQLPDCEKNRSFEFCAAFKDEKELALHKIKQLEQVRQERGDEVAQQVMSSIKERYERKNSMIQRALEQVQ